MLFLFQILFKNITKIKNKIKKRPWFLCCLPFCCGGSLGFYALRTILVSVVGVGIHWLNLTMRLLHVQCMAKIFDLWLF